MGLEVFNPFAGLLGEKQQQDSWRWGTIVSESPVRVRLDGDSEPSLATPDCLVPVTTGDRVRVQIANRRMTVFGRMGGPATAYPDANVVRIEGTDYPMSGKTIDIPAYTWTVTDPIRRATITMPIPFTPPGGWSFTWTVYTSTLFVIAQQQSFVISNGTQHIRIIQLGSSGTTGLTGLAWQLVKFSGE